MIKKKDRPCSLKRLTHARSNIVNMLYRPGIVYLFHGYTWARDGVEAGITGFGFHGCSFFFLSSKKSDSSRFLVLHLDNGQRRCIDIHLRQPIPYRVRPTCIHSISIVCTAMSVFPRRWRNTYLGTWRRYLDSGVVSRERCFPVADTTLRIDISSTSRPANTRMTGVLRIRADIRRGTAR